MIKSPLTATSDFPTFKITVGGTAMKDTYQVTGIFIDKAVNTISTARVVLMDGDPSQQKFAGSESDDFLPGKDIQISMGYHSAAEAVVFQGIITAQHIKVRSAVNRLTSELTLKCADKALALTINRKSKYYEDKKDSDVISAILTEAGLSKKIDATTFSHKKLVQFDCTDWDFMVSRADINGLITLCNDGTVEVVKPAVSASAVLAVTYGNDVIDFAGELDAEAQIDTVQGASWDGTQLKQATGQSVEPTVNTQGNLTGKKLAAVLNAGSYLMQTSVPEDAAVLKTWASAKLQKLRLARLKGYVTFPGHAAPKPGLLIQLNGFGARFNGKAFISGVQHDFEGGRWITKVTFGLDAKWFAERKTIVSPPAMGVMPAIHGLQIGTVKQLDQDPDGEYRILVNMPMVDPAGTGVWARLLQHYASAGIGAYFIPEVGDEVALGFLNDDPRYPIIVGALYGKKNKPPYTPESKNNTKGLVTKSNLKMTFDEEKKSITLETPGGNKITFSDDAQSVELVDQNANKVTLSSSGIILESAKDVAISAKGKFSVDANEVALNAKADVALEGNNVNAKAKLAFAAQGSSKASLQASGQVEVKGAMVMIN